jgi:hypothetical protein
MRDFPVVVEFVRPVETRKEPFIGAFAEARFIQVSIDRNRSRPIAERRKEAIRLRIDVVILHLSRDLRAGTNVPFHDRGKEDRLPIDKVAKGLGIFIGEIEAIEETPVFGERAGRIAGRAKEIVRPDLLLKRIVGRGQGLLRDHVDDTSRVCPAIQNRRRPFQHFHPLDVRGFDHAVGRSQDTVSIVGQGVEAPDHVTVRPLNRAGEHADAAHVLQRGLQAHSLLVPQDLLRHHLYRVGRFHDRRVGPCRRGGTIHLVGFMLRHDIDRLDVHDRNFATRRCRRLSRCLLNRRDGERHRGHCCRLGPQPMPLPELWTVLRFP